MLMCLLPSDPTPYKSHHHLRSPELLYGDKGILSLLSPPVLVSMRTERAGPTHTILFHTRFSVFKDWS